MRIIIWKLVYSLFSVSSTKNEDKAHTISHFTHRTSELFFQCKLIVRAQFMG